MALTFDDGPSPANTRELLELLAHHGARATFFMVGETVEQHPELVRAVADHGHEIGNHGYTHPRSADQLSQERVHEKLERASAAIQAVSDLRPTVARPPFGKDVTRFSDAARALGMTTVLWSIDSGDTCGYSADRIARFAGRARRGDIVLFHDGGARRLNTLQATAATLVELERRGLRAGTVSDLLTAGAAQ